MTEELLPCPFCGVEAFMKRQDHWVEYPMCRKCGCYQQSHQHWNTRTDLCVHDKPLPISNAEYPRMSSTYKRYPDLVLDELQPLELAMFFEQSVMLNSVYEQASFVHKMLLQAAHVLRQTSAALTNAKPVDHAPLRDDVKAAALAVFEGMAISWICDGNTDCMEEFETIRAALQPMKPALPQTIE